MNFFATSVAAELRNLVSTRAFQILLLSFTAMLACQILKFIIVSIRSRSPQWYCLITTGGFPSSHSSFVIALCITLGMFQWHDLEGNLEWSFPVAVVISVIIIHDAMGVRYEASKHARILNNLVANKSEEEKVELGYGKKGYLKEMLGHKGIEVLGGIAIGALVGLIGFILLV